MSMSRCSHNSNLINDAWLRVDILLVYIHNGGVSIVMKWQTEVEGCPSSRFSSRLVI